MNLFDLYRLCDNLNRGSVIRVHDNYEYVGEFLYMDTPHRLENKPIKGFRVYNDVNIEIWV